MVVAAHLVRLSIIIIRPRSIRLCRLMLQLLNSRPGQEEGGWTNLLRLQSLTEARGMAGDDSGHMTAMLAGQCEQFIAGRPPLGKEKNLPWLQQGNTPCYFTPEVMEFLPSEYGDRLMSRRTERNWPPNSSDLSCLDFSV